MAVSSVTSLLDGTKRAHASITLPAPAVLIGYFLGRGFVAAGDISANHHGPGAAREGFDNVGRGSNPSVRDDGDVPSAGVIDSAKLGPANTNCILGGANRSGTHANS